MFSFLCDFLRPFTTSVTLATLAITFAAATAQAEDRHLAGNQIAKVTETEATVGFRHGSFIVAPIPFSNPLIGAGLALGAGYLFQADPASRTSMLGIGAMKSENGSEAHGLSFKLALDEDRWTFSSTLAEANLNYDLLAGPVAIPLLQTGRFAKVQLDRKVASNFKVGILGKYLDTDISSGNPNFSGLPGNYRLLGGLTTYSLGLVAEYDTRDSDLYPKDGTHLVATALANEVQSSSVTDYSKTTALFSHYTPIGAENVLALRVAGCGTNGSVPFFDLCSIGGTDAMRGFNPTQYLGPRLLSAQAEYRHRLSDRFGFVAFAGAGGVGSSFDALNRNGYAGGVGLRYRVSKKIPVNFAVDMSFNDDGESLLYISVGERF
ncbi:BamA/TamA family outer membrane protein [Shimia aestuarii]|uniref:Surface antigen n=1 Tax=Shimia aestuarii TaxID=254406 RepID=A0A1I4KF61_9RHOB|nr:BamA/TamA family outer membrane protein [Shimia aestuarii]SFL77086.1 Surface antigen [Shimia aestuarii]